MRRLGGSVNHDLDISAERTKQAVNPFVVADVHVLVPVPLQRLLQLHPSHCSRSLRTEKAGSHIIINPDDVKSLGMEPFAGFRTDQTC